MTHKPIEHAVWPTGVPAVCTAHWTQESWDTFAEGYRPAGYTGDIHDTVGYIVWEAELLIQALRYETAAVKQLGRPLGLSELSVDAARCRDALGDAQVCKESRRGTYCEIGTCFVCTVARLYRGGW